MINLACETKPNLNSPHRKETNLIDVKPTLPNITILTLFKNGPNLPKPQYPNHINAQSTLTYRTKHRQVSIKMETNPTNISHGL